MSVKEAIRRQYCASLDMLEQAVSDCPEALWISTECQNRFWHISYHALFYTHLYLQTSDTDFRPWAKHRPDYQYLGALPGRPDHKPKIDVPYSKEEILEYSQICRTEIEFKVPSLDLDSQSGFHWLPFTRLEVHLYNIRHLQHHTGQLVDRLRTKCNVGIKWTRGV